MMFSIGIVQGKSVKSEVRRLKQLEAFSLSSRDASNSKCI